jgi:hypothetical protein
MRRSLTISPENERRIQGLRSITLGLEPAIDFDYTTAVNLLMELGFHVLEESGQQDPLTGSVKIDSGRLAYILGYYSGEAFNKESKTILDLEDYLKQTGRAEVGGLFQALSKLRGFQPKKSPRPLRSQKETPRKELKK